MTKEAAYKTFFSSFGISAFPTEDVPKDTTFPWMTYEAKTGAWGDVVSLTVNLWYYSSSNVAIDAKAQQMSEAIGMGGVMLPCDGGAIWLTRGSPWCQPLRDEKNPSIKRRYININAEFLTAN